MQKHLLLNLPRLKSGLFLVTLCIIGCVLSSKGITDESVISMQGDMPRYLMNGVYLLDFIRDLPLTDPFRHTSLYFAKYPALSLGHHPLLPSMAVVPFYALFGVSVFSARLSVIFFVLLGAVALYLLVRNIYNSTIAFFSSLLFVTTPFVVLHSRVVLSEVPSLSMVILSTYLFCVYCETEKPHYGYAAAISLSLMLYAKHTTVFIFPVLLLYLLHKKGVKYLFRKDLLIFAILIGLFTLPLAVVTLKFSKLLRDSVGDTSLLGNFGFYLTTLWKFHLPIPLVVLSALSLVVAAFQKDKRIFLFVLWIVSSFLLITNLNFKYQIARYLIFWIPPFCVAAATLVNWFSASRLWNACALGVLLILAGYQTVISFRTPSEYARGYQEVAKYVVDHRKGQSILYSGIKDTGYFIFFVRKYTPERDIIILRADKILATSRMERIIEERINAPEEIYINLQKYGVQYVVLEDMASESRGLEWLREEVKSDNFILRKETHLRSHIAELNGVSLAVYEYKNYTPAQKNTLLDFDVPVMGDSIKIPFSDLFL